MPLDALSAAAILGEPACFPREALWNPLLELDRQVVPERVAEVRQAQPARVAAAFADLGEGEGGEGGVGHRCHIGGTPLVDVEHRLEHNSGDRDRGPRSVSRAGTMPSDWPRSRQREVAADGQRGTPRGAVS